MNKRDKRPEQFRVPPGKRIDLDSMNTDGDNGFGSDEEAQESLRRDAEQMVRCQDMLMAHETNGLLILFQGMDASGKDEAITHVLSNVDPRGVEFKQFKALSGKEEKHDYLWRVAAALPARGQIGIFDRSYYEHVVTDRIHPEKLERQGLPSSAKRDLWARRYRHINQFEEYLSDNAIHLLKFFLHVGKDEQRRRLRERIERPETQWQFSPSDLEDRAHWRQFMKYYSEALTQTNTEAAPWHIIPADRSWHARAAVASLIVEKLKSLHRSYPKPKPEEQKALEEARRELEKG